MVSDRLAILHFDDETDSVSCVSLAILNAFQSKVPNWLNDQETVFDDVLKQFTLHKPDGAALTVQFLLVESLPECKRAVDDLTVNDIAIFDLMCELPNGQIDFLGIELYQLAIAKSLPPSRVFVLTGFPHLLESKLEVPESQKLLKPISATEVAEKLIALFPQEFVPSDLCST